jgi:hypothetical protein
MSDDAGDQRGQEHAGDDKHPQTHPHPAQDVDRQGEPPVEQDQGDPQSEHQLRADRVEWNIDHLEHRGPEQHSEQNQQQDLCGARPGHQAPFQYRRSPQ